MGSCASLHKSSQESVMKVGLSFGSKTDNLIIPPSSAKDKPHAANDVESLLFQDWNSMSMIGGSKDETFFDFRAYLDSDCDDDFFSVNGDFTPSRGNTPVHHNSFSAGAPRIYKATEEGSSGSASEISLGKKKKLVDLFRDNTKEDHDVNELNTLINQDTANGKLKVKPTIQDVLPPKSADGTPRISRANSRCSSERTAYGDNLMLKEKPLRSTQRCLPSLVSCGSFNERKKKMNPAMDVNYNP
ncbi:triacylglycerol lipase 2-like [Hibiscus syriacus]|uniref:Triacylglycerol lipase 2-like n=1 Tax=Hibiscus syriacus TaxID=106335 RepID=A0A6A3CKA9_HIBSY|nr:triacylglycerol lipase 2-like [Hibiscus syriacus]